MKRDEITGESRMPRFRKLPIWTHLTACKFHNASILHELTRQQKLYVFFSQNSFYAYIWGIGFNKWLAHVYWVCPWEPYMLFPFLRELVLWTGGISVRGVIEVFKKHNKSLCVPSDSPALEEMLAHALQYRIPVVPVLVQHERQRYFANGTLYRCCNERRRPPCLDVTLAPEVVPENETVHKTVAQLKETINASIDSVTLSDDVRYKL